MSDTSRMLRVRNWADRFEISRSRELVRPSWIPVPIELDSDGYCEMVDDSAGAAHLGVWHTVLMIAARCSPRGTLVRDGGRPHDAGSLGRISRLPAATVDAALARLLQVGWLEVVAPEPHHAAVKSHEGAVTTHVSRTVLCREKEKERERETESAPDGAGEFALSDAKSGTPKSEQPKSNATWKAVKFEEFWEAVWAKMGRGAAEKAFIKAAKTPSLAEAIIDAARGQGPRLLADAKRHQRTVIHPATWLRQERWTDEQPSPRAGGDEYPELQP